MRAAGLDPSDDAEQRTHFALDSLNAFKRDMSAVRAVSTATDASIFYNGGHVGTRHRAAGRRLLALGVGDRCPAAAGAISTSRSACAMPAPWASTSCGQTGKFHTSWGDFHSFKNLAALQFECFRMIAMNAKCMIGDQLPPSGASNPLSTT